ncbi:MULTISPECIES: helix-turn-helix domain-containing protein [Actinomadura]|uniref:LuxR C-terminal-related transcriptional regulator n=1 Tax=Actinomadura yumaensis TaxID=111807 RepID=A0ABW2CLC6_9ACTN|nr:helix-turn-helix transcriptional regulator [Actinomadura sp. J1-007]
MAATVHTLVREADHHLTRLHQIVEHLQSLLDLYPPVPSQRPGGAAFDTRPPADGDSPPGARPPFGSRVQPRLTDREQQVLALLVRGSSNRHIARALEISEPTVKNHLRSVFQKLDVADRTQAIAKVLGGRDPRADRPG